ncbi:MAG: hypothetical protein Q9184_006827 [Pyrenodesmia sp. 2 TL-2023]
MSAKIAIRYFASMCLLLISGPWQALAKATLQVPSSKAGPLPASPFFVFPNNSQAENIKPRLNGQLLVTVNTVPDLWQIDPTRNQSGSILHTFVGYTSLFGIVELQPDVFYVIASNFTGAPDYYGFQGSTSIFQVDLRNHQGLRDTQHRVNVSKVVDIPAAQLLDGFAVVNQSAGLLMSGDAQTGVLYRINTHLRTATAVLQDALLNGTETGRASGLAHVGVNGVKFYGSDLYFTNTAKGLYGKVRLDTSTGLPTEGPSLIENYGTYLDDLSFDSKGNQYISSPLTGILLRMAGNATARPHTTLFASLPGANSNAFGRGTSDKCILYSTFVGSPSGVARIQVGKHGLCNKT